MTPNFGVQNTEEPPSGAPGDLGNLPAQLGRAEARYHGLDDEWRQAGAPDEWEKQSELDAALVTVRLLEADIAAIESRAKRIAAGEELTDAEVEAALERLHQNYLTIQVAGLLHAGASVESATRSAEAMWSRTRPEVEAQIRGG